MDNLIHGEVMKGDGKNIYRDFEIWGEDREKTLARIAGQMDSWGLVLPSVEPVMFHFGLGEFENIGETEFWISNEIEAGYCAKYMFVFEGQSCPSHFHKVKHETFFMVKGTARIMMEGGEVMLKEGERLVIMPGTKHNFSGAGNCLILELSMPSIPGDSYFEDERIGNNGVL
jgi:mannose-6-phosphate isomerase-like protein (cupin superfamily)